VNEATVRFYAELNDFLPSDRQQRPLRFCFHVPPTVKDAIESLGVPHVEVDLILVNGGSVGFDHRLSGGDRVSVYPSFESIDIAPLVCLRDRPLREPRFVSDVHLRRLARWLRLLGFDALHPVSASDEELVEISLGERRILLTRDRALLKRGALTHGYWVRAVDPIEQAREVVERFDLRGRAAPFTRCLECNGALRTVEKGAVCDRIPPRTRRWLDEYVECQACGKLYWRGTHARRLERTVERILAPDGETSEASDPSPAQGS